MVENKNITLPKFLAFDYKGFNFNFYEKTKTQNYENLKNKLLKQFSNNNTLIIFNGQIIFNNFSNQIIVENNLNNEEIINYKNSQSSDLLKLQNKQNLNSALILKINNLQNITLNIIVAGSINLSHYSNYILNNSNITIEEQFVLYNGAKINYYLNTQLNENSNLNLVSVENISNKKSNCFTHNVNVLNNANLQLTYINLNNANTVNNSYIELNSENAQAVVNTLSVAHNKVNYANKIEIKHLSKNTTSEINNVGIVNHFAKLNIDGLSVIEKGYSKSNAYQKTKIINLSDTAKSIANPQLVINEYDVKAGHSANVGRLDDEQIYYLMSRGLTKQKAIELILMAYVNQSVEKINNKKLKNKVLKIISKKIV